MGGAGGAKANWQLLTFCCIKSFSKLQVSNRVRLWTSASVFLFVCFFPLVFISFFLLVVTVYSSLGVLGESSILLVFINVFLQRGANLYH